MKINQNNNSNLSFGWTCKTHRKIAEFALEDFPKLLPAKKMFQDFVQRPDFDELGTLGNWHFYSRYTKRSFVDFDGKSNALARYREHVKILTKAAEEKNNPLFFEHAGRALHFLQDMTQPHHTKRGVLFNKILELRIHIRFEDFVKTRQYDYIEQHVPKEPVNSSFDDIFFSNIKSSLKSKVPIRQNTSKWDYIGQHGFDKAVDSTRDFMAKISEMI